MNAAARFALRPACPVCASPACLGYTCEPMSVERARAIVAASIVDVEARLDLARRLARQAQGGFEQALAAGTSEVEIGNEEIRAELAWAGCERLNTYLQNLRASRLRLERVPVGALVDARDRAVARAA